MKCCKCGGAMRLLLTNWVCDSQCDKAAVQGRAPTQPLFTSRTKILTVDVWVPTKDISADGRLMRVNAPWTHGYSKLPPIAGSWTQVRLLRLAVCPKYWDNETWILPSGVDVLDELDGVLQPNPTQPTLPGIPPRPSNSWRPGKGGYRP